MPTSRIYGGAIRYTFGGEEVAAVSQSFHQTATSGQVGGSVMETLQRDRSGPSVELEPGNPASRTLIATALRMNLVRTREGGGWEDVVSATGVQRTIATNETEQAALQAKTAEAPAADHSAFDAADEDDWNAVIAPLAQHSFDGATASAIGVIALGHGSLEDTAKSLAVTAGMEPALALQYVEEGVAMHERSVARVLAQVGITEAMKESCYEAFRATPGKLQDALQRLVHAKDVSGFKEMALDYRAANTDLSAYTKAGFQAHVDRATGDILIQREGGSWVRAADLTASASRAPASPRAPAAPATPMREHRVIDPVTGNSIPASWLK